MVIFFSKINMHKLMVKLYFEIILCKHSCKETNWSLQEKQTVTFYIISKSIDIKQGFR